VGGEVGELCRAYHESGSAARHSASEQGNERSGSALVIVGGMSNVMHNCAKKQYTEK
jgi:hypothetical protein